MRVAVTNTLTVASGGKISADGGAASPRQYGGGSSGGSVWVTTKQLRGSGVVQANGGGASWKGGGGGGGRLAVYVTHDSQYQGSLRSGAGEARATRNTNASFPGPTETG